MKAGTSNLKGSAKSKNKENPSTTFLFLNLKIIIVSSLGTRLRRVAAVLPSDF
jgi:hypothetical protein